MISRQPGKDPLPIKYFYNATRESAWEFIVPADSPIKDLKDLKGKKIGVGALSFGNIPITKAMFKEFGFEAELLPVGVGAPAFLAFREKKVDALNLFDSQHATMEVQGTAIRRLEMPKKYKDLFSNGFVAHEDMIRDDPKTLAAFGRAIAKTSVFCEANRAACVKAFWTLYPNQKPTSGDEATNIRNGIKIMAARFDKYLDFDNQKQRRWGEFPAQAWKDFATTLFEGGQLSTKDIAVDMTLTAPNCPVAGEMPVMVKTAVETVETRTRAGRAGEALVELLGPVGLHLVELLALLGIQQHADFPFHVLAQGLDRDPVFLGGLVVLRAQLRDPQRRPVNDRGDFLALFRLEVQAPGQVLEHPRGKIGGDFFRGRALLLRREVLHALLLHPQGHHPAGDGPGEENAREREQDLGLL